MGLALLWLTFRSTFCRENVGKIGSFYIGKSNFGSAFTVVVTIGMRLAAVLFITVGLLAVVGVL
jgi:hypothetical protein